MITPEISVIMPVYNVEKFLSDAIESILKQTYSNFELLILNDKSTDGSLEIIKQYQAIDSRIILIDKEVNVGPANLRNEGFRLARGRFIALMDADDISLNNRFKKQISILKNNPEIGVCGTWYTVFGAKKNKTIRYDEKHNAIKVSFLSSNTMGNPTAMFRKEVLNGLEFNNDFVPVEDYDLWSRLLPSTKFYNIQESLLNYRQHDSNISKTKISNVNQSIRRLKINQMSEFGIESSDTNIDSYLNALSLKRGLLPEEIIAVLKASKYLIEQNKNLNSFDQEVLEKKITKNLIRTIRNARKYELSFYIHLKKKEKSIFKKINIIDKIIIFSKSSIGWEK
jgi:glycosyltransferase involved in cell wall biosynthesis